MRKRLVSWVAAVVAVVGLGACSHGDPGSVAVVNCNDNSPVETITASSNGFTPTEIAIHPGDVVRFAMSGTESVLSGHTPVPIEDRVDESKKQAPKPQRFKDDGSVAAKALVVGQRSTACFEFDATGTYGFHSPQSVDGTVYVRSHAGEIVASVLDWPGVKWVFLILALVMPLASLLTWAERRQSAMMQDRLGPNRANIGPIKLFGILHFVADAVKMIFKEDFIPENVHKGLFTLAPILALAPVLIAFCIIPFGPDDLSAPADQPSRPVQARDEPGRGRVRRLDPTADLLGRLRPDLLLRGAHARELRRHDRRLGELQQVGAARRPAQLVADDVVRGRDGLVADGRVRAHRPPRPRRDRGPRGDR